MTLSVTKDLRVVVKAPLFLPQARIDAFVAEHEEWVARHLRLQAEANARARHFSAEETEALKQRTARLLEQRVPDYAARMGVVPRRGQGHAGRRAVGLVQREGPAVFFLPRRPAPPRGRRLHRRPRAGPHPAEKPRPALLRGNRENPAGLQAADRASEAGAARAWPIKKLPAEVRGELKCFFS